jgi:hypothetical protein
MPFHEASVQLIDNRQPTLLAFQVVDVRDRASCYFSQFPALIWRERVKSLPLAYVKVSKYPGGLEIESSSTRICGVHDGVVINNSRFILAEDVTPSVHLDPVWNALDTLLKGIAL